MLSSFRKRGKAAAAFLAVGGLLLSGIPVYAGDTDELQVTCSEYDQEVLVGSDSQEYMNSLAVYIKNSGSQPVDLSDYEVRITETSDTGSLTAEPAVKEFVLEAGGEAAVYVEYAVADDCTAEKITYQAEITEKGGSGVFESNEYTLIPFTVKDGILKYNDASRQEKYQLQFEGDAHVSFGGLIYGGSGNATEIRHADRTVEYYLAPGAESTCSYTLDDGYEIDACELDPQDAGTVSKMTDIPAVSVDLRAPAVLKVTSRKTEDQNTEVSIASDDGFAISAAATEERIEAFPKLRLDTSVPQNAETTISQINGWLGKTDRIHVYQLDVSGVENVESGLDLFKPEVTVTMPIPEGWDTSRSIVLSIGQYGMGYVKSEVNEDGRSLSFSTEVFGENASNQFAIMELSVPTEVKDWDKVVEDYIDLMRLVTWGNHKEISDLCYEKTPSADVAVWLTYRMNNLRKYNADSDYYNAQKHQLEIPYNDLKAEAEKLFENVPDMTSLNLEGFVTYDSQNKMFVFPEGGVGDAPLVTEVVKVNELGGKAYSIQFKLSNDTIESNPDMTDPSQYAEYTLTVRDNGEGNWKYVSFAGGFIDPEEPEEPSGSGNEGTDLPADSVDKIVQEIDSSRAGSSVTVEMGSATVVPEKVLEAAKGKDVDVVLQMDGYTWTINGKDITASDLKDINLEVKEDVKVIESDILDQLADGRPAKQIRLVHDGEFGFTAELRIYVGTDYEGQYGNLFWCRNGKYFTYIDSGKIDAEGYVSLTMSHASDYVIVVDEKEMSQNDIPAALRYSVQTGDAADRIPLCVTLLLASATAILAVRMKRTQNR